MLYKIFTTMLNQTYYLPSILYKAYTQKTSKGPCCDGYIESDYHRRCVCKKQDIAFCKGLCDSDDLCKGYVKYGNKDCEVATTKTDCDARCNGPYDGSNQDALVDTGRCEKNSKEYRKYKGCFIKNIRK